MPGPRGIVTVKGSFELSDLCDKEFHKMAQNFGVMASYGEPKAKKHDYRSHAATRRKPQGTRNKETSSTATRAREVYKRRGEGASDIGE
jgi:hypothetical protein